MKRREWLKGLFCAPLLAVTKTEPEQIGAAPGGCAERVTVNFYGTTLDDTKFSDKAVRALTDAQRRGRLPMQ